MLVIGDDWLEQLERYKSMERIDPLSPYIVHVDVLSHALEDYQRGTSWYRLPDGREFEHLSDFHKNGVIRASRVRKPWNITFAERAKQLYGVKELDPGTEPDFSGKHRWGWMRLNEVGEVVELVERTVPGEFLFCFVRTSAVFLLKPGATGWDVVGNGQVTEVTEGYAGSARLSDIDFHAMRQKQIDDFQERWNAKHRSANGKIWIPFDEIRRKYPQTERYDEEIERAASHEWWNQPALQNDDYARHRAKYGVLGCGDVIRYGQHLSSFDEDLPTFNEAELLAELDDDALLTMAVVRC